jgi:putative ABC transport system permease protein
VHWWQRLLKEDELESTLDRELRDHFDRLVADNLRRGMTAREARRQARLAFGGLEQVKDACREARGTRWVSDTLRDVRFAARLIRKEPGVTLVAVLALALGIGTNNVLFTVENAMNRRGLPIEDADRVLYVGTRDAEGRDHAVSFLDFKDWQAATRAFDGLAAFNNAAATVSDAGRPPDRVTMTYLSASGFRLIGERPALGRDFRQDDDRPEAPAVAMLGDALWKARYGADPGIIDRVVSINGSPAVVIGVMSPGFRFPFESDLWQPLARLPAIDRQTRDQRTLGVLGRLADGSDLTRARTELDTIAGRLAAAYPATNANVTARAVRFGEQQMGPMPMPLPVAGGFVLLIACANVASLLLARTASRTREVSIRRSIGATRWRVVRQLLVESVLLALLAGAIGGGLSLFGVRFIASAFRETVPYWVRFTLDGRVFGFLFLLSLVTSVLFGLAPAIFASKADVVTALKEGGRTGAGPRARRWTNGLLVAELALTIILLAGAGLMVRSFLAVYDSDRVIDAARILTMRMELPAEQYQTPDDRRAFFRRLDERLAAAPAGVSAALASALPFLGGSGMPFAIEGRPLLPAEAAPRVSTVAVGFRYFETLGLQLVRGRPFSSGDSSVDVAIVNQRFVEAQFRDQDPIGHRIALLTGDAGHRWLTIVGVAPTVRQGIARGAGPVVYIPHGGSPGAFAALMARGPSERQTASWLREEVRTIDPDLPLFAMKPLSAIQALSRLQPRMIGTLLGAFALIALALSAVGLYAVTAYGVTERTHEIGLRMALGARPGQVVWLFIRRSLWPLAGGLGLGLCGALAIGNLLRHGLIQTSPTDPVTLTSIISLLLAVAIAACYVPARRAARVDPLVALRQE